MNYPIIRPLILFCILMMSFMSRKSSAWKYGSTVRTVVWNRLESSLVDKSNILAEPTKRGRILNPRMLAHEDGKESTNDSEPNSSRVKINELIRKNQVTASRKQQGKGDSAGKDTEKKSTTSSVQNTKFLDEPEPVEKTNPHVVKPLITTSGNTVHITPTANRPPLSKKSYYTEEMVKDRPFTLPPGEFRPKQSLGQNYLSDQNYVKKIIDTFHLQRKHHIQTKLAPTFTPTNFLEQFYGSGQEVVEIGPGAGALTRTLLPLYPKMTAIEIDQRAIELLSEKLPDLSIIHQDVLTYDWRDHARRKCGNEKINIIANLPYYIVSQVLFTLADAYEVINLVTVTMQWELAVRMAAQRRTKDYGIPSVVFQLYGTTQLHFKIPPTVFFPVPKVDSALISFDFSQPHPDLHRVDQHKFRRVVSTAFRQRRKMMRQSLKELLLQDEVELPAQWSTRRPEDLEPVEFLELTSDLYGEVSKSAAPLNPSRPSVWRRGKAAAFANKLNSITE